jgi:hypothetical protein
VGVPKTAIQAAKAGATKPLVTAVQGKLSGKPTHHALGLAQTAPATRVGRLFRMLTATGQAERMAEWADIMEDLRRELPGVLAKLAIKPSDFGFKQVAHIAQLLGEALLNMETRARTLKRFARGLEGWRWNVAGRVLFERMVKYHPGLQHFFLEIADQFRAIVNQEVKASGALLGIDDKAKLVTAPFGKPRRVVEFIIVDAADVERPATDFGFVASNEQGLWAILPIELKMPAALSKVAGQFSEFLPRLRKATALIAVIEEDGKTHRQSIDPKSLVFMEHDRAQVAVAPLSRKQLQAAQGGAVASVAEVEASASAKHDSFHYRLRLLVDRRWLEAIVRLITD